MKINENKSYRRNYYNNLQKTKLKTIKVNLLVKPVDRVAQSVQRLATGWTVWGSNPGGARFSAPVQTGPGAHPASCKMGTGSFSGINRGRRVTLTPHALLVMWSRKSRAIPLLPLWAVRPLQSLSACTRVHFTFTLLVKPDKQIAEREEASFKDTTALC